MGINWPAMTSGLAERQSRLPSKTPWGRLHPRPGICRFLCPGEGEQDGQQRLEHNSPQADHVRPSPELSTGPHRVPHKNESPEPLPKPRLASSWNWEPVCPSSILQAWLISRLAQRGSLALYAP